MVDPQGHSWEQVLYDGELSASRDEIFLVVFVNSSVSLVLTSLGILHVALAVSLLLSFLVSLLQHVWIAVVSLLIS